MLYSSPAFAGVVTCKHGAGKIHAAVFLTNFSKTIKKVKIETTSKPKANSREVVGENTQQRQEIVLNTNFKQLQ
ncbi:MAG: hypothetical protein LPJ89_09025 [Hymenobacteraceae bacterium]|nr:hypothetical protein [Hymenobacteraceae bacterium]MDX5397011.1 hypothetical protein [Hymenobacteraceae bacterium]MDX5443906.1 hypothetical protein [Hymenobacteraceae bacterium]MDX5513085.1 hypothetical protein [Hymenobacteraceae bacterium]